MPRRSSIRRGSKRRGSSRVAGILQRDTMARLQNDAQLKIAEESVAARNKAKAGHGAPCYKDKHCTSNWCDGDPHYICIDPVPGYKNGKSFTKYKRPNGAFCFNGFDCISTHCSKNTYDRSNRCSGKYPTPEQQERYRKEAKED